MVCTVYIGLAWNRNKKGYEVISGEKAEHNQQFDIYKLCDTIDDSTIFLDALATYSGSVSQPKSSNPQSF